MFLNIKWFSSLSIKNDCERKKKDTCWNISWCPVSLACVQTIPKLWLVPSAKQRRDLCSGPPTDSTNYRKCVSNSPSTWLAITTNKTKPFLTGQSWRVLKSGYTAGSPEQGFRRCFADGVNQSLISSARRLRITCLSKWPPNNHEQPRLQNVLVRPV